MDKHKTLLRITVLLLVFSLNMFFVPGAKAGELEDEKDIMTRVKTGELSSHDISFALSSSTTFDASETITINFGEDDSRFSVADSGWTTTDFGFNDGTERTIANITQGATPGDACSGHDGANNIGVEVATGTGIITFKACATYSASSAPVTVDIEIGTAAGGTNRVTNPSANDDIPIYFAGTVGDTGSLAISIIADDQVVVSATVDPTFSFSLSSNTCSLGTLSTTSVATCGYDGVVSTNAEDGYATTIVEDHNLRIDASNDIDDTSGDVDAGSEEYGFRTSGTDGQFNVTDEPIIGTAKTIAQDTSGPISSATVTVTHKASISSSTLAGSYSHIVTLISTGTF